MSKLSLNKNDLKYIVSESTKRIINEISWGTSHDAHKKSENRVDILDDAWSKFSEAADALIRALHGLDDRWGDDDPQALNTQGPKLGKELENLQNKIYQYIQRKTTQMHNLNDYEEEKFRDAFGGRNFDQVANDIDKKWDEHFNDDENFTPWSKYRQTVLSKDEQDFNDRNP